MRAVYAGESSTNYTRSVPLFYLQTSETFWEFTMRTVILNGHSTILGGSLND